MRAPASRIGRRSGRVAVERLLEQCVELRELRRADVALQDLAVLVDDEGRRRELHVAELLRDAAVVERDLERQLARLRVVRDVHRRIVVHRDRDEFQPLTLEAIVGIDHLRHFLHAGRATRRPEIHEIDLAFQVAGGRDLLARQQREGRVRHAGLAVEREEAGDGDRRDDGGRDDIADGAGIAAGGGRGVHLVLSESMTRIDAKDVEIRRSF